MSNNELPDSRGVSSALQREQERERRRMRDRQRRESMTAEEREKHLARRRRNYQLRRQRAGHAQSGSGGDQAFLPSVHEQIISGHEPQALVAASDFGIGQSSGSNKEFGLTLKDLDADGAGHVGEKLSIFNRKLRLSQVRHLARSLDSFQRKLISAYLFSNNDSTSNGANRINLRLTQVKCLARELNSSMNDATSHIRQSTTRSSMNSEENPSSQEVLHNYSDQRNTAAELDSHRNHDDPSMLMVWCL
ncbi:unnamed protein product [Rhodiola kirilowii]